jgi:hypothetical protein
VTHPQRRLLFQLLRGLTISAREDRIRAISVITKRELSSSSDLTENDFRKVIDHLQAVLSWEEHDRTAEVDILTRPAADPWAKPERSVA